MRRIAALLLIISISLPQAAFGWGEDGHIMINRVAAQKLPQDVPAFLRNAVDDLAYLGPEPDRWRSRTEPQLKYSQEPDHFIDIERLDGMKELPAHRYEFFRMLYAKRLGATGDNVDDYLPEKVGLQPYIAAEVYGRLKAALREYRALKAAGKPTGPVERVAIHYAGWLGHYVADVANPLHTTIHYNGWAGKENPQGYTTRDQVKSRKKDLHWDFESRFVRETTKEEADFAGMVKPAEQLKDPFRDYFAYIQSSNKLVEPLYQLEKAGAFDGKGSDEGRAFLRERLAFGAQMLRDMWYTAWIESAQPLPEWKP